MKIFEISDIKELKNIANEIIAQNKKIIVFYGKMGAGKTTLIKEICNILKVSDNVTSPTFSIINEYKTTDDKSVFHFDFYRIETPEELINLGIEEYLFSDEICLIEWPQIIEEFLDNLNYLKVNIEIIDNKRKISF